MMPSYDNMTISLQIIDQSLVLESLAACSIPSTFVPKSMGGKLDATFVESPLLPQTPPLNEGVTRD